METKESIAQNIQCDCDRCGQLREHTFYEFAPAPDGSGEEWAIWECLICGELAC